MKRSKIRLIAIGLCLAMASSAAACNKDSEEPEESTTTESTTVETTEGTTEETTEETTEATTAEETEAGHTSVADADVEIPDTIETVSDPVSFGADMSYITENIITAAQSYSAEGMYLMPYETESADEVLPGFIEGFSAIVSGYEISIPADPAVYGIGAELYSGTGDMPDNIGFEVDEDGNYYITDNPDDVSQIISEITEYTGETITIPSSADGSTRSISVLQFDSYEHGVAYLEEILGIEELQGSGINFTTEENAEGYTTEASLFESFGGMTMRGHVDPDGLTTIESIITTIME